MNEGGVSRKGGPHAMALGRIAVTIPIMLALLFLPAGTFAFWEAWAFLATLLVPALIALTYLARHDPALLERRLKMKETEPSQKLIMGLAWLPVLLATVIPGLDARFGWSHVPVGIVVAGDGLVLAGYCVFLAVIRANPWASRVVEVVPEQSVVTTGPYARVRHPMYVGVLAIYLASPLALGSWWALIPAALLIPILIARILNEEAVLERELPGYIEYENTVCWRLVPGIW